MRLFQIAIFQKRQKERVITFLRSRSVELERKLKEVRDQCCRCGLDLRCIQWHFKKWDCLLLFFNLRQVAELKLENEELKKPLSQRRVRGFYCMSHASLLTSLLDDIVFFSVHIDISWEVFN